MIPGDPEETINQAEEEKQETGDMEQALAEEREKAQNYLANWQRAQADFENFKRRTEQEKEDLRKYANSTLILNFLSLIDDLERAFASLSPEVAEAEWVEGIKLIERKFISSLETQGLSAIEAVGKEFDPNLHEAIRQDKGKEGEIIDEVQKGYTYNGRVLRPSQVIVGNGETE